MDTVKRLVQQLTPETLQPGSNLLGVLADAVQDTGDEELAHAIRSGVHDFHWGISDDGMPEIRQAPMPHFSDDVWEPQGYSAPDEFGRSSRFGDLREVSTSIGEFMDEDSYNALPPTEQHSLYETVRRIHAARVRVAQAAPTVRDYVQAEIAAAAPDMHDLAPVIEKTLEGSDY